MFLMKLPKIKAQFFTVALVVLAACAPTFSNHGYAPTDEELEAVVVGVDNRASVEETVGRPSSTGLLRDGAWYYVSTRMRHRSYHEPEVVARQVVTISFSARGTVTNIERFGLEDGRVIALNRRVTEANIKGITVLQQLLGNLGRIDPGAALTGGAPP